MKLEPSKFCPLIKEDCRQLGCKFFTQVRGMNPNTGQMVDEWECALALLPMLVLENTKEARGVGATIDKFRDDVKKAREQDIALQVLSHVRTTQQIEG